MLKKRIQVLVLSSVFFFLFLSCEEKKKLLPIEQNITKTVVKYANGFTIERNTNFTVVEVSSAWPGAETAFKYALVPKEKLASITFPRDTYDAIITTPVEKIIVTSTTHIPALDTLGVAHSIVGFPNCNLISSPNTRSRIEKGYIKELGNNETLNTEIVLDLNPDVVIGFGINNENKAYETLKRSNIPVVYNGDWTEQTPLGKAEWIKFFAPFFEKEDLANQIFKGIETAYNEAKLLAKSAKESPTILTGGLYKDVWHVAGGKSWMAQFLQDANGNYLWADNKEKGGIPLSFEAVFEKGQRADFWFNPSLHATYDELRTANTHYQEFDAYKNKTVFSNAVKKGPTGGLLYYELAPNRPDLVLKDLISILHPGLLAAYHPHFFMPLR